MWAALRPDASGPGATRAFFAAQIEPAKLVQRADFRRREASGPPTGEAPELARVLRPRIDALNREQLAAPVRDDRERPWRGPEVRRRAEAILRGDGIDAEARDAAIRTLIAR